jgi:nitrite reductase/ring-hydroxylating ferredoxin subunit
MADRSWATVAPTVRPPDTTVPQMGRAGPPSAAEFPAYPATWYLFGAARDLRHGPVTKTLLGRPLVAYGTGAGKPAVMDARCSHLSADLGRGCVVGDRIRCPFHGWEYGPDGRCLGLPDGSAAPAAARQRVYPAEERHGFVFFFNGRVPLFPLPFFSGETPADFVPGRRFQFVADCGWFMLAANGFDEQHFRIVHGRRLTAPPRVDCPAPFARRMDYVAEVTGSSIFDRLLRRFAGPVVRVTITSWGGPLILVTGEFRRARSYMTIATQPWPDGRTLSEVIVFAPRGRSFLARLVQPLGLWVRRVFTHGFMRDEYTRLAGIRYNPHCLVESDRLMIEFFQWIATLPQDGHPV